MKPLLIVICCCLLSQSCGSAVVSKDLCNCSEGSPNRFVEGQEYRFDPVKITGFIEAQFWDGFYEYEASITSSTKITDATGLWFRDLKIEYQSLVYSESENSLAGDAIVFGELVTAVVADIDGSPTLVTESIENYSVQTSATIELDPK